MFSGQRHSRRIALLAGLCVGAWGFAAAAADTASGAQPALWQSHRYEFHYVGFTSIYSCSGLEGKMRALLTLFGAKPDFKLETTGCTRGEDRPDRMAGLRMQFSTLQPAAAGTEKGVWRHIALAPSRPFVFDGGDCELIQQFHDLILPMFTTRDVRSQMPCVPHEESSRFWELDADVLAPPPSK